MIHLLIFNVKSQLNEISINQPSSEPRSDFPLPLIIFVIVLGAVTIGLATYIAYKRIQAMQRTKLEQFLNRIDDISNIVDIEKHLHTPIIEKHLNVSFLYRLKIVENPKIKLSMSEKEMVAKARSFMKENNFDYFYSLYLLPENACTPKDYQTIFNLIEKGVFQPLNPNKNDKFRYGTLNDRIQMKKDYYADIYNHYLKPEKWSSPKDDRSIFNFDRDDSDRFPFPYIFNHPRPPDDLAPAAQVQVRIPPKKENTDEEVNCQYCGMELSEEAKFTHSCKKKPI